MWLCIYLFIIHHCQSVFFYKGGCFQSAQVTTKSDTRSVESVFTPAIPCKNCWSSLGSSYFGNATSTGECPHPSPEGEVLPGRCPPRPRGESLNLIFLKTYPGVDWGLLLGAWGVPKRRSVEEDCAIFPRYCR